MAYFIKRPVIQLRQAIIAQSKTAERASCGLVRRAKPTAVKIVTGNPSVRMPEAVITVCWMSCNVSLTEITSDNESGRPLVGYEENQMIKIATGTPTPKAPLIMNKKSENQIALSSRTDMPSLHRHNGHEQAAELNEANTDIRAGRRSMPSEPSD